MKTCSYCGTAGEDSQTFCYGCGQALPKPAPTVPPLLSETAAASSRMRLNARFRLREPSSASSSAYKVLDTKSLGGVGTVQIESGNVMLTHDRTRLKVLLIVLWSIVCLPFILIAPRFPIVAMTAAIIYFLLCFWAIKLRSIQRRFPLSQIVNAEMGNPSHSGFDEYLTRSILRAGANKLTAVNFVVVPGERGTRTSGKNTFVTIFPSTESEAATMMCLLSTTVVDIGNTETKAVQTFAATVKAATPHLWATPTLVGLNVLVFLLMCLGGANPTSPNVGVMVNWGANWGPLTTSGESWRLLTSCFLHFGVAHLLFNMYALLQGGLLTERFYGNWFFLAIYIGSGLGASLTSLWWHPEKICAGASGAIFGVYGALAGYLVRHRGTLPPGLIAPLARGVAAVVGYNLLYGMTQPGIDQAAHLGGLVSGTILGFCGARPLELKRREEATNRVLVQMALGLLVVIVPLTFLEPKAQSNYGSLLNSLGATFDNGAGVPKNPAAALRWYRKAAAIGSAEAEYNLGRYYFLGNGGLKDYNEAVTWFRQAADHGFDQAEVMLGAIYYNGEGIPQDFIEARKWIEKAAERGLTDQQFLLALLYYQGRGAERDISKAIEWARKAAEGGNAKAEAMLAAIYMQEEDHNFDDAVKWARKAANHGQATAQALLAALYSDGKGVEKDYVEAYAWVCLAMGGGAEPAPGVKTLYNSLVQQMSPTQVAMGKRRIAELRRRIRP